MYQSALNFGKPAKFRGTQVGRPEKDPFAGQLYADTDAVSLAKLEYNDKPAQDQRGQRMNSTLSWTWVRMLPTLDEDDPSRWAPGVLPDGQPGQWFRGFELFMGGVKRRLSFIAHDPNSGEDKWANPAYQLALQVRRAVDKGQRPEWEPYVYSQKQIDKRDREVRVRSGVPAAAAGVAPPVDDVDDDGIFNKYSAPLGYPVTKYFVRALVLRRGLTDVRPIEGLSPESKVPMLVLSQSAGPAILADLAEFGYNLDLRGGTFHCFFREGDDPWKQDAARNPRPAGQYELKQFPSWDGTDFPSPDLSAYEPLLRQKLVPFGEVFRIPDLESQAELLATAFPYEILAYGWRGDTCRDFLKIAKRVHANVATVDMAAAQAPAYQAPGMPAADVAPAMPPPGVPPAGGNGPAPFPTQYQPIPGLPAATAFPLPYQPSVVPTPPPAHYGPPPATPIGAVPIGAVPIGPAQPTPNYPPPAPPRPPVDPAAVIQQHMPPRAQPGAIPQPGSPEAAARMQELMASVQQQLAAAGNK